MNPHVATIVFVVGIWGLFWLDRDNSARTSKALWIPVLWLLINGSRPVSDWLQVGPTMDTPDQYLDGSPLDAIVWGVLLAGGLLVLVGRRRQVGAFLRENGPILLFFAYCALSILWSDHSFVAFKRWTKAIGDVVMVLVVLTDPDREAAVKRLLARAGFVLIPLSVLFVKYYPDLGRSYNPWTWVPTFSGVTTGKNLLGMTCLVCGLGSLWHFLAAYTGQKRKERTRRLIAHGTILAMVIWLFSIADSMTSLSCFVMAGGLMVMTSLSRFGRKTAVVHLAVAAIVGLSVCALFLDSGGSLVSSLGRDATLTGRTEVWKAVLSLKGNPLLGTGFESFWLGDRLERVWFLIKEKGIQEAHNGYLEVYLNLGWIGVTLLAVIIVTSYKKVIAALRRDPDLGRIRLAFFVVGVVYNFTEAGFRMMSLVWIGFLLATMAVPKSAARVKTKRATEAPTLTSEGTASTEEVLNPVNLNRALRPAESGITSFASLPHVSKIPMHAAPGCSRL
jgi:exopolysaccharide production protein ExoQ